MSVSGLIAQDSSRCAGIVPCAGTRTTTRPSGAAGGKISFWVITARFESADSIAWSGYWIDAAHGVFVGDAENDLSIGKRRRVGFADFDERRLRRGFFDARGGRCRVRVVRSGARRCGRRRRLNFRAIDAVRPDRRRGAGNRILRRRPCKHDGRRGNLRFQIGDGIGRRMDAQGDRIRVLRIALGRDARAHDVNRRCPDAPRNRTR